MQRHQINEQLASKLVDKRPADLSGFCQPDTRVQILRTAGLVFDAKPASIDEKAIKEAGVAENIEADDITITLAELKADKIARQYSGYIIGVISC